MLKSVEEILLSDESATEGVGRSLAKVAHAPLILFLQGDLGAGKTTLIRGFLRGLNFKGAVKSPTYTLVEEYLLENCSVYHFDLYRITHPEELEFIGIREYFNENAIVFVEWPERGISVLPKADLLFRLEMVEDGRRLDIQFLTERGLILKPALMKCL